MSVLNVVTSVICWYFLYSCFVYGIHWLVLSVWVLCLWNMNIGTFCVAVLFMDFAGTFSMWVVLSVYVFCVWNMLLLYACVET